MSPLVTTLYGEVYSRSALILVILLVGVVFASIGKIAPSFYHSIGKPRQPLIVAFFVCLLNVALNLWWIPIFGIKGSAFASTISYTFYGLFYLWLLKRKEGFSITEMLIINRKDVAYLRELLRKGFAKVGSYTLKK